MKVYSNEENITILQEELTYFKSRYKETDTEGQKFISDRIREIIKENKRYSKKKEVIKSDTTKRNHVSVQS